MAAGYAVLSWLKENKEWFYKDMRGRLESLAAKVATQAPPAPRLDFQGCL